VSLNTFIVSVFGVLLSYFNNVITMRTALFVLSFASIQLVEFFGWRAIERGTSTNAAMITGVIVLALHPVMTLYVLASDEGRKCAKQRISALFGENSISVDSIVLALGITYVCCIALLILAFSTRFPENLKEFHMVPAENGHLRWKPPKCVSHYTIMFLFALPYILCCMTAISLSLPPWMVIVLFSTLAYSLWAHFSKGTFASMWCWTSNILCVGLILLTLKMKSSTFACINAA
jgi:hypothetical protein